MRKASALAMAGLILLAGCLGAEDDPEAADEDAIEPASEQASGEANTSTVTLYDEMELHAGAGGPHPQDDGGLAEPVGATTTDSFEVGPEVQDLSYEFQLGGGTGQVRVEVYDPEGTLVFGSTQYDCAGAPGAVWTCIGEGHQAGQTTTSGTYEVRYYVAGAVEAGLVVEGQAPASAG